MTAMTRSVRRVGRLPMPLLLGVAAMVVDGYVRDADEIALPGKVITKGSLSREEIDRWLDTADRYSSWRDNIANAVPVVCERRVNVVA